jgi:serine/threonine-protein kinase
VITLTLLHPIQSTPVQSWTFEQEPVIRIGRSTDNHVILYSAVVSRHHVELRLIHDRWEIINLGANGTYLDGKQVAQVPVVDGVVIRLARSGPNIQIHLGTTAPAVAERSPAQRPKARPEDLPTGGQATGGQGVGAASVRQMPQNSRTDLDRLDGSIAKKPVNHSTASGSGSPNVHAISPSLNLDCAHHRATEDMLFCPDCGQPLRILQTVGDYQVVKLLWEDRFGATQLVWRNGQSLLLKTLNPPGMRHPEAVALFEQQAAALHRFNHPGLPRFTDFFRINGQPYLVQEQIYGQNLFQRVATHGTLTTEQAIVCLLQVCDVLDYLHQQTPPFLHQNLKPENLIQRLPVISNDSILVTGFVPLSTLPMDTQPTVIGGYGAPEQQQGYATAASDLYALGPTLVYLLTGKEPGSFYAQREQGYRFYPEYIPGLPTDLTAIVRRLTNPKPEERYATAAEVATALLQVVPCGEKL